VIKQLKGILDMAGLTKAQRAARAEQKVLDEDNGRSQAADKLASARAALAEAENGAAEAGIEVASPAIGAEAKKNTSTVWIGLKLPRGLQLKLCKEITIDRPTFGGGVKPTKMFMPDPDQGTVRLKGYAVPFGKIPNYSIIGDFGLTEVDRTWWGKWKAQNSGFDLLKNGLLFEHGEKASVEAYAQEHAELKCGLEPLDPTGDKRADPINSENLSDIEPDMERSKTRRSAAA